MSDSEDERKEVKKIDKELSKYGKMGQARRS
jgi:hypothetical protein